MEEEPSPVELAARSLQQPGGVQYWTDFLKVRQGLVLHSAFVYPKPLPRSILSTGRQGFVIWVNTSSEVGKM